MCVERMSLIAYNQDRLRRCRRRSRDVCRETATQSVGRGLPAHLSVGEVRHAQTRCHRKRKIKIICAHVGRGGRNRLFINKAGVIWADKNCTRRYRKCISGVKTQIILNYCVHLSLLRHINCIASAMQTCLHCSRLLRILAALRTKRNRYDQFYRSEMCNIAYCRCHVRCSVVLLHCS